MYVMTLILWFIILILVLVRLTWMEGFAVRDKGKWYTIKHSSVSRGYNEIAKTISCDYLKYPPATKLKECVASVYPTPLASMELHPHSIAPDTSLGSKYYMVDPGIIAGTNTNEQGDKWVLFKHGSDLNVKLQGVITPD